MNYFLLSYIYFIRYYQSNILILVFEGGTIETCEDWMVAVEQKIVCRSNESYSVLTGLTVLFSLYFVFNLKYQPEAEATLEFMQRFVAYAVCIGSVGCGFLCIGCLCIGRFCFVCVCIVYMW